MQQIQTSSSVQTPKNIKHRISDVQGGVSLTVADLVAGNIVEEATPLTAPASGKRTVCKQAKLLSGSTTTVMRVKSGTHHFKTGDIIFQVVGGAAYACTVALEVGEVGGVTYDTITVGTALESGAEGTWIYQSSVSAGEGAATGALENTADAILAVAFEAPTAANTVYYLTRALLRADVVQDCIGTLYLASLKGVIEIKY